MDRWGTSQLCRSELRERLRLLEIEISDCKSHEEVMREQLKVAYAEYTQFTEELKKKSKLTRRIVRTWIRLRHGKEALSVYDNDGIPF